MTSADPLPPNSAEVVEVYEEDGRPIAGGRWEVLIDESVQYVRPSGQVVAPAVVSLDTLRSSPTWRRVR